MTSRRGVSSLGCLFGLLLLATGIYFGVNVAEVYWRYYQYRDDMQQEVRFSSHNPNEVILGRLSAAADSLGLPESASRVSIRRMRSDIIIEADYYEHVELPGYVREIHFHPRAEGPL